MTRVLLTGASGGVATRLRPELAALGWELRLLDRRPPDPAPRDGEELVLAELNDAAALRAAVDGVDLVVHLAGIPAEDSWERLRETNVDGTLAVLEAARPGRTPVLFASSNHAVGATPVGELRAAEVLVPRPDSYYGASKAAAEALCSLYADRFGMTIVSARIVNAGTELSSPRARIAWFSPADHARLAAAVLALREPGHRIVWGVSRGGEDVFPLEAGRRIGFEPRDDARRPGDEAEWTDEALGREFLEGPLGGVRADPR